MKSLSLAGRMDTCIPVAEFLCCSPEMVMTLLIGCVVVAVQPPSRVQLFVTPGLQHARPLCPSPSPGFCPSSCSLPRWCHPAISFSDALFFCPQSFPTSGTFPMSHLVASDDWNTGASASALQVDIQGWFPWRLPGLIFCCESDSQESSPTPQLKGINSSAFRRGIVQRY